MLCGQTRERLDDAAQAQTMPNPHARATDADRQRAVDVLGRAFGEGLIRVEELDDRIAQAYAAATHAELNQTLSDLPPGWVAGVRRDVIEQRMAPVRRSQRRREVVIFAAVMALMTVIWLAAAFNDGGWYPWPLWPAFFWGFAVLRGGRRHREPSRA